MVPQTLQEWSLEKITELLTNRYMEQETFDWKERLPHSKNDEDKKGLRKDCCAFANSNGGFLVFGVADETRLPAEARLVGIDPHEEFGNNFGSFPSECKPSVQWEPRNPPISLPNGNVIHVVWIPRSWNGPHSTGKAEEGFTFPKRTNRGNEYMSYEEVRMFFLGYYEKRMKLLLLHAELDTIKRDAASMKIPKEHWQVRFPISVLHLQVFESVLVDGFSILHKSPSLVTSLMRVRTHARDINANVDYVRPLAYSNNADAQIEAYRRNESVSSLVDALMKESDTAIQLLKEFLVV